MEIEAFEIKHKLEDDNSSYCFYTEGLSIREMPELELRNIPPEFMIRAKNIIMSVAEHMLSQSYDKEKHVLEIRDMMHKHSFPLSLVELPLGSSLFGGACIRIVDYYEEEEQVPQSIDKVILQTLLLDGINLLNNESYKEALELFEKCNKLAPKFSTAYKFKGEVDLYLNDTTGAIEDFTKAIEMGDDDSTIYYNRAIAYGMANDYENSIKDINRYIELCPDEPIGYEQRIVIYDKFGKQEEAKNDRKFLQVLKQKLQY
ncbi:MAG: hypothetical protein A2Y62_10140 [Candidatus Fischerbacteria bacterium RBG_13_37_8]|uniref:Uncharacterized protein n=1 Tax=Candidatus Fischerbacteria bacterium RBG_13_37_8 TaxID=1817863 RepID=A0A1F5V5Y6_9BACT|nr:MAG: hypothetical protein A2Y62_10140 [Candidatus Fischerbacteria bacterium RBG_13_37_8]